MKKKKLKRVHFRYTDGDSWHVKNGNHNTSLLQKTPSFCLRQILINVCILFESGTKTLFYALEFSLKLGTQTREKKRKCPQKSMEFK